jgi:hypothetical protein
MKMISEAACDGIVRILHSLTLDGLQAQTRSAQDGPPSEVETARTAGAQVAPRCVLSQPPMRTL